MEVTSDGTGDPAPFPCPAVNAPRAQELTVLRNHACHSNQNLLQMQKGGNILRNRNDPGVLLYPLVLALIPIINHIQYKGGREGKGEIRAIVPLPLNPSLLISESKAGCVGTTHTHQEEIQTAELVLCSVSLLCQRCNTPACMLYEKQIM